MREEEEEREEGEKLLLLFLAPQVELFLLDVLLLAPTDALRPPNADPTQHNYFVCFLCILLVTTLDSAVAVKEQEEEY